MFCSKCGKENANDAKFCAGCGAAIGAATVSAAGTDSKQAFVTATKDEANTKLKKPSLPSKRQINFSRFWLSLLFIRYADILYEAYSYSAGLSVGEIKFPRQEIGLFDLIFSVIAFSYYWKVRNRKRWVGALVGVLIATLVASLSAAIFAYFQKKVSVEQLLTEMHKSTAAISKAGTAADNQGVPKPIQLRLETTPNAKGEVGEVERYLKASLNTAIRHHNDCLRELDESGWNKLLDAKRIERDKDLVESKLIVKKTEDILSKCRAIELADLESKRRDFATINVGEPMRKQLLSSFDSALAKNRSMIDARWDLEEKNAAESKKIIALLSTKIGSWSVEGGKIVFQSKRDLEEFNSYVSNSNMLSTEEAALIRQQNAEADNSSHR